MTKIKALSAAVILSAAFATPVFAEEVGARSYGPTYRNELNFRGAYNGPDAPSRSLQARRNLEDFGFTGRDRSRPGGWDADLTGGSGN
jgi:hypothetical protein